MLRGAGRMQKRMDERGNWPTTCGDTSLPGFVCTEPEGHEGDHACRGGAVGAVWPRVPSRVLDGRHLFVGGGGTC